MSRLKIVTFDKNNTTSVISGAGISLQSGIPEFIPGFCEVHISKRPISDDVTKSFTHQNRVHTKSCCLIGQYI